MTEEVDALRTKHRRNRAALSAEVQSSNSTALCKQIEATAEYQHATRIAAYIAIRGEISLAPLLETPTEKRLHLPVLRGNSMHFVSWSAGSPLFKQGFGLLEPDADDAAFINPYDLDLVLVPLVAFDDRCNRIGQGGGFYDRTFAHKKSASHEKPVLMGVAHSSQRETRLKPQSWDVPLDCVVTNSNTYR